MKIVAGKFKGKTLIERPYEHIRPTADMVKQSIFNKLQFNLLGAKVLDLFCGTGALGIEALSRGADKIIMADGDKRSVNLAQDNLKLIGSPQEASVMLGDFRQVLSSLNGEKFDIIILDPPYQSGIYHECLVLIERYDLLAEGGIIVCEQDKSTIINYSPYNVQDERIYGIKKVAYLVK